MKGKLLSILRESGDYVSGQELCERMGVSRTAVWKAIKSLQASGHSISSRHGRGYRLEEETDLLSQAELESQLAGLDLGSPLYFYPQIGSTNTQAKLLAEERAIPHGSLLVADWQSAGRGRRGRDWMESAGENIAMSLVLRPAFSPAQASMLTLISAHSMAAALEELTGLTISVKWPNDLVVEGRKICGILTEMSAERDYIHYVVIGIGVNVSGTDIPPDIRSTASSIALSMQDSGRPIPKRSRIIATFLERFEADYHSFCQIGDLSFMRDSYNTRLAGIGGEIRVLDPAGEYTALSEGIDDRGDLMARMPDGELRLVYSGEVSVRGLYGYV